MSLAFGRAVKPVKITMYSNELLKLCVCVQYLFKVDSINALVMQGASFREAYQSVGTQVQAGTYKSKIRIPHTHLGSIYNLSLNQIKEK